MRGLVHLTDILGNLGVIVLPQKRAIGAAYDKFDDVGNLKDEHTSIAVKNIAEHLVDTVKKLA